MSQHEQLNYIELPASDLAAVKAFFSRLFGWKFVDYGPDYCAFFGAGVDGGFYRADLQATTATGSVLLVFYSEQLEQTLAKVRQEGGEIVKPVFAFPGGRRFHFSDPNGNEYAVWSDKAD